MCPSAAPTPCRRRSSGDPTCQGSAATVTAAHSPPLNGINGRHVRRRLFSTGPCLTRNLYSPAAAVFGGPLPADEAEQLALCPAAADSRRSGRPATGSARDKCDSGATSEARPPPMEHTMRRGDSAAKVVLLADRSGCAVQNMAEQCTTVKGTKRVRQLLGPVHIH